MAKRGRKPKEPAPAVYEFHDYREFIRARIDYLKRTQKGFSLRTLAAESGFAPSFISMVLHGKKSLTEESLEKIFKHLALSATEESYVRQLRIIGESDSPDDRAAALKKIQNFLRYRKKNSSEVEVYQYLTKWYYVAIREMVQLDDFNSDPKWIQSRLRIRVPLSDIKDAFEFLVKNGYVEMKENRYSVTDRALKCHGGVYKMALHQFHRQMLKLKSDSIQEVPSAERNITSCTMTIDKDQFDTVVDILDRARKEILDLAYKKSSGDNVYHVSLGAFPITQDKEGA